MIVFGLLITALITGAFGFWSSLYTSFTNIIGLTSAVVGPEDAYLNIQQLTQKYGYPLEEHTVITEDQYILKMHRIPIGKTGTSNGKAVFLMHGIWESSNSFLLQGPNKALGYILADEGFDVWMGNARGNKHTFDHMTLSANTSKFWEFSWEEIGLYDLPAMIDYSLNVTGQKSLYYVGYSQGTTSFFVMTSMKPEYNEKIKLMFALAPEVFLGNATSPLLKIFSPAQSYLPNLLWSLNIFTPDFLNNISPVLCSITPGCGNVFLTFMGPNNVSEAMWPVVLGHTPTGSSFLQFMHYGQLTESGRFCRYDFGKKKNLEKYGTESPPDYSLENVSTKVVLFYSNRDVFSNIRDVGTLKSRLINIRREYFVKEFTHVDYMYADQARNSVYMNVVRYIQNSMNKTTIM